MPLFPKQWIYQKTENIIKVLILCNLKKKKIKEEKATFCLEFCQQYDKTTPFQSCSFPSEYNDENSLGYASFYNYTSFVVFATVERLFQTYLW